MKRFAFAAAGLLAMSTFAVQAADAQVRRGAVTDGQGNGAAGSVNCARTPNAQGCRAGATTRTADGEVNHRSGFAVEGETRSATSEGGFTKSADGTVNQGRTTTATGANGSVTVDGAYTSGEGRTRTVTCADASGAVVACPQQ